MPIEFSVEPFSDKLVAEFMPLLVQHYNELMKDRDIPLSPDFQRYYALAQARMVHVVTARKEGELVGYAVNILQKGNHYSTASYAANDIIFIRKDLRKGMTGIHLLKFMEEDLRKLGITFIQMHVKPEPDFGPVLLKMGYRHFETIYQMRLDK